MLAAQYGHTDIVQALLKAGAMVNLANTDGRVALMFAAQNGHTTIVQALTKAGARPDLTNISGQTALMLAAQKGRTATVQALIKAGADIHIHAAPNQRTALGIAIGRKRALVVELLVRHGARQASSQPGMVEAFIVALATGSGQVLQALFDGGLDPTPQERKAIRQSNQQADPKLLQLVAAGCKSLAARIHDAHHAGQHQQANQLIGEHLRSQPTHPLGLASCATWLTGSGNTWTLAPGSAHAMASLLAGHDMQRARRLFSHGLRSEVVAAIITAWDSVAGAVAHLATLTASGRIRVAGAAPEDALFAFALQHSEPLLQLVDPAYPNCSSDPIVTLQVKALLQANAAHAALTLDTLLDPEAAMTLLGEDMPELLRLWLTRQADAQLRKPGSGQG
jgi:hypothetical protein